VWGTVCTFWVAWQTPDNVTGNFTYYTKEIKMRWRDVRFDKLPTAADGDENGEVLFLLKNGSLFNWHWDILESDVALWMPLSELPAFDRIPDPPDGWQFRQEGDAFDRRAQHWNCGRKQWVTTGNLNGYSRDAIYIVPIDPPEPQYRPFANAKEFEPYFGKLIKEKSVDDFRTVVTAFSDKGFWLSGASVATKYSDAINIFEFADGTPFGVRVDQ
jgi:hypothetical protein